MDKKSVIEILDRFHHEMKARGIIVQKLILYGSYADGTNHEGSDIDIVVISDDFTGKDYWERIEILTDVIYEIDAPIEAVAMTREEWDNGELFITDFARNGEVFFAA